VLFYGSPVLYPLDIVPETLRDVILVNPLASLFELARVWVIDPGAPGPVDLAGGFTPLLAPIAIYAATCVLAVWIFRREAPLIAEQL
jgi:ABC-type polysaccharide/polyol phosphate export permease